METIKCKKCGAENPQGSTTCKYPACDSSLITNRELFLNWWNNLDKGNIPKRAILCKIYFPEKRHIDLTEEEIEEIWRDENLQKDDIIKERINDTKFKSGVKVKCLKNVEFADGSRHYKGEIYYITEETEAYFYVCSKNYELIEQKFKTFNSDLFKAYVNKFSEEDKLKALGTLALEIDTIDVTLNRILNDLLRVINKK